MRTVIPDPDSPSEPPVVRAEAVHLAIRLVFLVFGPFPVLMIVLSVAAVVEVVVELIARDGSYFQDHVWCRVLAFVIAGMGCYAMRFTRHLEAGRWIGPLVIGYGIYLAFA